MHISKITVWCLGLLASVAFSMGATAQTTIIYSSGHDIDEVAASMGGVVLAAGNPVAGFDPGQLAAAIGDGTSGIYGAYDALVIGENVGGFSPADLAAIAAFTSAGGNTVVLGAHGDEVNFLNATFGYVVTNFSASSSDNAPISRVSGTGPAGLLALNGSWFIDGAPGTVLYTRDAGGDAAFIDSFGSGTVSWLAWDFCECGNSDTDQANWFSVLGGAAIGGPGSAPGAPSAPIPTLSEWALLLLVLLVGFVGLVGTRSRLQ